MNINGCLGKKFLTKTKPDNDLIEKEFAEAEYDLEKAEKAFDDEDYKWAIVKSYYCIFHAARAMLFKLGLKENRHFAIGVVLEDLNKNGKLESKYVNQFNAAISSREDADYHYIYSNETAAYNLQIAQDFLERMKKLIKVLAEGNL
jgi:uncharacterized protein (UPF0332 family)